MREELEGGGGGGGDLSVCSPCFLALRSPFYLRVCASRSLCSHRLLGLSTRLSIPASLSFLHHQASHLKDEINDKGGEGGGGGASEASDDRLNEEREEGGEENDARRAGTRRIEGKEKVCHSRGVQTSDS